MKTIPQTTIKNHKTNPLITSFLLLITLTPFTWAEKEHKAEIYVQTGHAGNVLSIAFSPDGKTLVSGSSDNTIKMWDIETSKFIYTTTTCPGDQWIVTNQSSIFYSCSPRGGDYASIRFDDKLRLLYPLNQYPELKIPEGASLSDYLKRQSPSVYPKK